MEPRCPPNYVCSFTPAEDPGPSLPWYETGGGAWVLVLAILTVAAVTVTLSWYWLEARKAKRDAEARAVEARAKAQIEEQRTMQADAAKGDADLLRLIRSGR